MATVSGPPPEPGREPGREPGPAPGPDEGPGAATMARALRALQEQHATEPDERGWAEVAGRLGSRLSQVSRPGRPLLVREDGAGAVRVDQRVLVDAVRRAVRTVPGARPVGVQVEAVDAVVQGVGVEVWVRYGVDARSTATAVREVTAAVLVDVLDVECPVDVAVVDLEVDTPG